MVSLSQLTPLTTAAQALGSVALVVPSQTIGYQPNTAQAASPLGSFTNLTLNNEPALVFHYEGEQTVNVESDITDHYVEENYGVQDHIARRPEVVTTRGFIGELNDVAPSFLVPLQAAANTLTSISAYSPAVSATAQLAYNEAFFLYQTAAQLKNSAVSAFGNIASLFGDSSSGELGNAPGSQVFFAGSRFSQNKQQQMFTQFYGYYYNRVLFNIQTPWAIFTNMAIMKLRPIQDAETNTISTFEVTFKKVRVASLATAAKTSIPTGQLINQAAPAQQNPTANPTTGPSMASQQSLVA